MTDIVGSSVSGLKIKYASQNSVDLSYEGLTGLGVTTAILTCTIGSHSASLPITITVKEAVLPDTIDAPSTYTGLVNTPLHIPRPGLLPADSDIPSDLFVYQLSLAHSFYTNGGNASGHSSAGYYLTASQPGTYLGRLTLSYNNYSIEKLVTFVFTDETGAGAGHVLSFTETEVNEVYYLNSGNTADITIDAWLADSNIGNFLQMTPKFSVNGMSGQMLSVNEIQEGISGCTVRLERPTTPGVTTFQITATIGEYSNSIPVTIEAINATLPETMETSEVFYGQVGVTLDVPRPVLKPLGTDVSAELFEFKLDVYGGGEVLGDSTSGYQALFSEPGMYNGSISMEYANIFFYKDIKFLIADENGNYPADMLSFVDESKTFTCYLTNTSQGGHVYFPFTNYTAPLGEAQMTLSNIQGTSVENLRIHENDGHGISVAFDRVLSVGETTGTLTCQIGSLSDSVDFTIEVVDVPLPTGLDMPDVVNGLVGEELIFTRPGLLPADTGMDPAIFDFYIDVHNMWYYENETGFITWAEEPGYYPATAFMYNSNLRLSKSFIIAISDANGNVPGSPFNFSDSSLDATLFLNGQSDRYTVYYVYQYNDLSNFGTGVWTLGDINGDSVDGIWLDSNTNAYAVGVRYGDIMKPGLTTATLTYTLGDFSDTIPVSITVSDAPIPTGIDMPSTYEGTIGDTLHLPQPGLLPVDSPLNASDFSTRLEINGESLYFQEDGVDFVLTQAGYLTGTIYMSYGNIYLQKTISFEIKDESGVVPGSRIGFVDDLVERTFYYEGESEQISVDVSLINNPAAYGSPVYTVTDIQGSSIKNFVVESDDGNTFVWINALVTGFGETRAVLNCTVGPYTASVPLLIHVPEVVLPTGLDVADFFTGTVNQDIIIQRPGLLPAGQEFNPDDFWLEVSAVLPNWESQNIGEVSEDGSHVSVKFDKPGYHPAMIIMGYENVVLSKNIYFEIADANGTVPGDLYTFSQTSIEKTYYLGTDNRYIHGVTLTKILPSLGDGIWSLKKLDAGAPTLLASHWVDREQTSESYNLTIPKEVTQGTYRYEITCVLDGKSTIIPLTLTVSNLTPASVSYPQTVFTFREDEWFTIPELTFNPGDTGIDASGYEFFVAADSKFWDNSVKQDEYTYKVFEPGYYNIIPMLSGDDDSYSVDVMLIITAADGTLPAGSPLEFTNESKSLVIDYPFSKDLKYSFSLKKGMPGLGEPQYTITPLSGTAVSASIPEQISAAYFCTVDFEALQDTGESTFQLTVSAGGVTDTMTITVKVSNATLPTAFAPLQTHYDLQTGQTLSIARPGLLPEGTGISQDEFEYSLYIHDASPAEMSVDNEQEKVITFTRAGYYSATLSMSFNNTYLQQKLTFTVTDPGATPPPPVLISDIAFHKTEHTLEIGKSALLDIEIQPINPSNPNLLLKTDDETIVKYDAFRNLFTALRPGTVTVTASAQDGSGVSATCTITVPSVTYDMSQVAWTTTTAFNFDGTEKTVELTGLPAGVTATYTGNTATEIGTYTASVELTYENPAFVGPTFADLPWEITEPVVPTRAKPKITKVEAVSASALKLTWGRVAGASGYNVYVSARPNDSYTLLKSTTALSLSITRLKAGTRYFYKVEAYDLIGGVQYVSSPMSSWAAGVPLARPAITSITSPSARRITLTWNKSAGAGGWQVMFATSAKGPWKVVRTIFVTNASFAGLKSGSTFYFKIRPYKKYYAYAYFGPESPVRYVKVK